MNGKKEEGGGTGSGGKEREGAKVKELRGKREKEERTKGKRKHQRIKNKPRSRTVK